MFYQTYTARKAAEITPPRQRRNGPVSICSERVPFRRCRGWWEWTARFLSLVSGYLDL